MIEINITDVYCFVFTDLRSYAGNKYEHFVTNNSINEIQFINFYHKLYVLPTLCKETSCFTAMATTMFYSALFYFYVWPLLWLEMYLIKRSYLC